MLQKNGVVFVLFCLLVFTVLSVRVSAFSFCNAQGQLLQAQSSENLSNFSVQCTLQRDNGISSLFLTQSGSGFPDTYTHYYRCPMLCSNTSADFVSLYVQNGTHEGQAFATFSDSTLVQNISIVSIEAPVINTITGNVSGFTGSTITLNVSGTDNLNVTAGNIFLSNGSVIAMTEYIDDLFSATFTLPLNDETTLNYYVVLYDQSDLNATSTPFSISVVDSVAPTAALLVNATSVGVDKPLLFNASNSSDNIGIVGYLWDFNDSSTSNESIVEHTFTLLGTFVVSLTVTDARNNTAMVAENITVLDLTPPTILTTSPASNVINATRKESIAVTFSRSLDPATVSSSSFVVSDQLGTAVKGIYTYDSSLNQSMFNPFVLLASNTSYTINLTTNIKATNGVALSAPYVFTFSVKENDLDNDDEPDYNDTDDDGDGLLDALDKVKGSFADIDTNLTNISVKVNDQTNLSQNFTSVLGVGIYNGSDTIATFNFDFDTSILDLTNITLMESSEPSRGQLFIYGLDLKGTTKTVYLLNNSNSFNGVCVKDREIAAISEITDSCNATDEFKVKCDGTANASHTCVYQSDIQKYRITGLQHSGLQQIAITDTPKSSPKPATPPPAETTTTAAAAGGGGGGGGSEGQSGSVGTSVSLGACQFSYQCGATQQCVEGQCVEIDCPQGNILFNKCVPYECTDDSVCGEKFCNNHKCVDCIANDDCDVNQYCVQGECHVRESQQQAKESITIKILKPLVKDNEATVQLLDSATQEPISNAELTVIYSSGLTQNFFSDDNGMVSFLVKESGEINYHIKKIGYPLIKGTFDKASFKKHSFLPAFMVLVVMILAASYFMTHTYFKQKKFAQVFDLKGFFEHDTKHDNKQTSSKGISVKESFEIDPDEPLHIEDEKK